MKHGMALLGMGRILPMAFGLFGTYGVVSIVPVGICVALGV